MPTRPALPCLIATCPERQPCPVHARVLANEHIKGWYHLARWRNPRWGLRAVTLRKHPICVECKQAGRVTVSTEVDHVIPHRGDPLLFWDPDNLQGLCTTHHAEKTNRGE